MTSHANQNKLSALKKMARVKGVDHIKPINGGTRLQRALFEANININKVPCKVCGLMMRKSNMARHVRRQHRTGGGLKLNIRLPSWKQGKENRSKPSTIVEEGGCSSSTLTGGGSSPQSATAGVEGRGSGPKEGSQCHTPRDGGSSLREGSQGHTPRDGGSSPREGSQCHTPRDGGSSPREGSPDHTARDGGSSPSTGSQFMGLSELAVTGEGTSSHQTLPFDTASIPESLGTEASLSDVEESLRHLPITPSTEKEIMEALTKLYAKRVISSVGESHLSYNETQLLTAAVHDSRKLKEMAEVLATKGFVLHTQAELDQLLKAAEQRGKASIVPENPVTVVTTQQQGGLQTVQVNTGGPWGIRIVPYRTDIS